MFFLDFSSSLFFLLFFFFLFSGLLEIRFFFWLNCFKISCNISLRKKHVFSTVLGVPLWALFSSFSCLFFPLFFLLSFFLFFIFSQEKSFLFSFILYFFQLCFIAGIII